MALVLIPSEQANVQQISTDQTNIVTSANATVTNLQTKKIPDVTDKEATNKKVYDYQHAICSAYDSEIAALNGVVVTTPLVEQDIINRSNFTGRLFDGSLVNKDIVRIPEMDGGNTVAVAASDSELNRSNGYAAILSRLTSGLTTTVALNGTATSAVTPSSTTFTTAVVSTTLANKEFVFIGSGQSFIGLCTSVTNVGAVYTIHFSFVSTFVGTISTGAFNGTFHGFTNTERTNKVSTGLEQTIMNFYIAALQAQVNAQIGYLNSQVAAISQNTDPALPPTALTNINSTHTALSNYLATTLISDAGINSLNSITAPRTGQINSRVTAITAARVPFYNKRYFWAVERAGANGTLIQLALLNQAVTAAQGRATTANAKLATIQAGVL